MSPRSQSPWRRRAAVLVAGVALALHGTALGAGEAAAQSSFTFTGGGWGHGVGMSQWGARGMAANGWSWGQILTHYYSGTAVGTQGTSNDLKVLLAQRTSTFTLTTGGSTTILGVGTVPSGRTLTLTRSGEGVRITGALSATTPGPVLITYEGAGALKVSPPGYSYRFGLLGIGPDANGGLRAVIGDLAMQEYLYGIGEMPSSWPAEALKAQAAASRTYAQKKRNSRGSKDYDLHGSVLDQAYTGTKFDVPAWRAAVDATNNRVITHNGGLIDAVYSASSGGHTENSEVVWVSSVPYLRGVPDFYDGTGGNPNGAWSRTYTGAQLGSWFGLGTVTGVQVVGPLGASGRVDKATIRLTGTGGSRDVAGATFRATVNSRSPGSQLMSTKFSVGSGGSSVRLPKGDVHTAYAQGRTVIIGGTASDPDGAPVVRVVSTMGSQRAVRETRASNGSFLVLWDGSPGTRNVCVSVLDQPTGQAVSLGCRDVVVK